MENKFKEIDLYTCQYLEELNLSYKEMLNYFDIKVSVNMLRKKFSEYGIKHKTKKQRIKKQVLISKEYMSVRALATKYKCSVSLIEQILKENKA